MNESAMIVGTMIAIFGGSLGCAGLWAKKYARQPAFRTRH